MTDILPQDVRSIELRLINICFPDYFLGSDSVETLAVPVYHGMSADDFYKACENDFLTSTGFFDNVENVEVMFADALRKTFPDIGSDVFINIHSPELEDDETMYAYISLTPRGHCDD